MERTELPTAQRLEALRAEGIVPYSPVATASMALVAAVAAIVLGGQWGIEKVQALFAWSGGAGEIPERTALALLIMGPALAAAFGAVIGGLAQTRGIFKSQRLAPRPARLVPFGVAAPVSFLGAIISRLIWMAFSLSLVCIVLWTIGAGVFAFVALPLRMDVLLEVGRKFAASAIICGLTLAVLGTLVSKLSFRLSNRMTREEVRAETDEG
ncbi:MAG: EscU/YscU/HrcU family type III secretion system export apparatus switch protein [Bdellovibrionota bacterium]|nr:MAG: EscU/YscU/HrcU family type III secretion system export apparatus switch protein [Bdellovibrionota bacterium]